MNVGMLMYAMYFILGFAVGGLAVHYAEEFVRTASKVGNPDWLKEDKG